MKIEVSSRLEVTDTPKGLCSQIRDRLTIRNPKFDENEKMGRWNGKTEEFLYFYEEDGDTLILPRGFARQLHKLCRRYGVDVEWIDNRRSLPDVDFHFTGQLRPFQEEAVRAVVARESGTLSAPTGSGKTVMALHLIARRRQPALVVVHTRELLRQWIDRIGVFLDVPPDGIGRIGEGKKIIGEKITVALVQSLYKCADEVAPNIGHLVVDECHRAPSRTFSEAVTAFDSRYMLGLSATPWRRDKLSQLIYWHIGDVVHEIKKPDLEATGDVLPAEVVFRTTDFSTTLDPSTDYSRMLAELTRDEDRNALIVRDVEREARRGAGVCLVLSDRKAHCEELRTLLAQRGVKSELLTGDLPAGERQRVVTELNQGGVKILVATGQLIGEGFDCRELSTLFLATPIKFSGRLIQYLGRVLRPAPGKDRARIVDYVDEQVGVLKAAAKSRAWVYQK